SAAKGVRRHGVDPNRSRNEEDMLLLSLPAATLPRPSSLPDVAPAASLGADLRDRCQTNQHTTADIFRPASVAAVVRIGRNLPWKPTVRPNATRTSSSNISLISSPKLSSEAIEVRGSTTGPVRASAPPSKMKNFGIGQNTEETLPNFRQKSKAI
ncbi:N-terminal nucleophile aminohydrolases superfamily protein, partial [Prunus dulcis]